MNNLESIIQLLKETLSAQNESAQPTEDANRFNADAVSVSKDELSSLSNEFTNALNSFAKLVASQKHISDLDQAIEQASSKRETEQLLENRRSSPQTMVSGESSSISDAGVLSELTKEIEGLAKAIDLHGIGGGGERADANKGMSQGTKVGLVAGAGALAVGTAVNAGRGIGDLITRGTTSAVQAGREMFSPADKAPPTSGSTQPKQSMFVGEAERGSAPRLTTQQSYGTSRYSDALASNIKYGIDSARQASTFSGGDRSFSSDGTSGDYGDSGGEQVSAPNIAAGDNVYGYVNRALGANKTQWDIFRNTIAAIESGGKYDIYGGSGNHYDGRYQIGRDAKIDGAKTVGISNPGHSKDPNAPERVTFRKNTALQENIFAGYTAANHRFLSKRKDYAGKTKEQQLQILGYAHNQGMGGAAKWMTTGVVGADGFGTKGTKYTDALASAFRSGRSSAAGSAGGGGRGGMGGAGGPSGTPDGTRLVGTGTFLHPTANKRVTSRFGPRNTGIKGASKYHQGIDYGPVKPGTEGDPIYASAAGVVSFTGARGGYGNLVIITHDGPLAGYETRYAHLKSWLVKRDQRVKQGQHIAALGKTGVGNAPHLHFEVRQKGTAINPLSFLGDAKVVPSPKETEPTNEDSGRNTSGPTDTGPAPTPRVRPQVDVPSAEVAIAKKMDECNCPPPVIVGGGQRGPSPLQYLNGVPTPTGPTKITARNPAKQYKMYFAA
jgi:murein DD-endopeptidase MepM/ murein hydrolase activator NlpD